MSQTTTLLILGCGREQFMKFQKVIDDLKNIEVKLDDEDKYLILLSSLTKSFKHFKNVFLYIKGGFITLVEVQLDIRANDLTNVKELKADNNNKYLNVSKGRRESKEHKKQEEL